MLRLQFLLFKFLLSSSVKVERFPPYTFTQKLSDTTLSYKKFAKICQRKSWSWRRSGLWSVITTTELLNFVLN